MISRTSLQQYRKDIQSLDSEQEQLEGYVSTLDKKTSELDSVSEEHLKPSSHGLILVALANCSIDTAT